MEKAAADAAVAAATAHVKARMKGVVTDVDADAATVATPKPVHRAMPNAATTAKAVNLVKAATAGVADAARAAPTAPLARSKPKSPCQAQQPALALHCRRKTEKGAAIARRAMANHAVNAARATAMPVANAPHVAKAASARRAMPKRSLHTAATLSTRLRSTHCPTLTSLPVKLPAARTLVRRKNAVSRAAHATVMGATASAARART